MPDIAAVIFDMYETLAHNTASLWVRTFDQICHAQGLSLTGQELWDQWKSLEMPLRRERVNLTHPEQSPAFKSYEQAWRECFERVFDRLGKGDAAAAARRSIGDLGQRDVFSETASVVAQLKGANHFRLGVLSNADDGFLWPLLQRHSLEFDAVVSSEAAQVYKPHPQAFQTITEALDVLAEACVFVGDSQFDDVQGAHNVGMRTVWVNRRGAQLDPTLPVPDYQVESLTELLDILGVPK